MTATKGPHWIASVLDMKDVPTPDLIDAKHDLRQAVLAIEAQLGAHNDDNVPPSEMLPAERIWRARAKTAMRLKQLDIDRITTELRKREHPDYRKEREHRRAVDILADLVDHVSKCLDGERHRVDVVLNEAKALLAIRETT